MEVIWFSVPEERDSTYKTYKRPTLFKYITSMLLFFKCGSVAFVCLKFIFTFQECYEISFILTVKLIDNSNASTF